MFKRPVIPISIAFLSGSIASHFLTAQYTLLFGLAGGVLVWLASAYFSWKRAVPFTWLGLWLLCGFSIMQAWSHPDLPANHVLRFSNASKWMIQGEVVSQPQVDRRRTVFKLAATQIERDTESNKVQGNLRVSIYGPPMPLAWGDVIRFPGKIRPLRNFNNPGGFDYIRYMRLKGIEAATSGSARELIILNHNQKSKQAQLAQLRTAIGGWITQTATNPQVGAVMQALIVGLRQQITPATRDAFARAGASHLLAISGLHIGLVVAGTYFIGFCLLGYFKPLLWNAWVKKGAAVLALLPAIAYALLAGLSPATQRALIMAAVFLAAYVFDAEHDPLNTLALAALLILGIYPPALWTVSFQLSFAAVTAILFGWSHVIRPAYPPHTFQQKPWYLNISHKLGIFFGVSVFAILGTLPLGMYYFNQFSIIGPLANFLLIPLVGWFALPLGLAATLLYLMHLPGATVVLSLAMQGLAVAMDVVMFCADLPFAACRTITPNILEITCGYVIGGTLLKLFHLHKSIQSHPTARSSASTRPYLAARRRALILLGLAVTVLGCDTAYWVYQRYGRNDLQVTALDVGQGSATLLELPRGYTVLIDGGGFADNTLFDVGRRIIAPYLWRKKITTIDTLILTHPESDHLNGLLYIAQCFNVKNLWKNDDHADTHGYQRLLEIIAAKQILTRICSQTSESKVINGVKFNILSPPSDRLKQHPENTSRHFNNNSLVIRVQYGETSFLIPGDIMAGTERRLVRQQKEKLNCTVLWAPHHGSRTSSTMAFIRATNPKHVVISSGWRYPNSIPHPTVLERYDAVGCQILQTRRQGAIHFTTDGRRLSITPTLTGAIN